MVRGVGNRQLWCFCVFVCQAFSVWFWFLNSFFFFPSANRVGRTGWLCMHAGEGVSMMGRVDGWVGESDGGGRRDGRRPCKVD